MQTNRFSYQVYLLIIKGLSGDPGKIRTSDLRFRKPSLYPSELQGHLASVTAGQWDGNAKMYWSSGNALLTFSGGMIGVTGSWLPSVSDLSKTSVPGTLPVI